jgi:hypothetical protein
MSTTPFCCHRQIVDVGQFVVQSGQLSGTLSPWVLKYFVEYFTPFTGLLPLVRASPHTSACLRSRVFPCA